MSTTMKVYNKFFKILSVFAYTGQRSHDDNKWLPNTLCGLIGFTLPTPSVSIFLFPSCLSLIIMAQKQVPYLLYWFPRVAITQVLQTGGFKQQKLILSQFQKLEVLNQGIGRAMLSLQRLQGRIFPCLFLPSSGCQQSLAFLGLQIHQSLPVSTHEVLPVCRACPCGILISVSMFKFPSIQYDC